MFPLRIFITSRPSRRIDEAFQSIDDRGYLATWHISTADTEHDIKLFFDNQRTRLPREGLVDDLVRQSDGIILWANLVLKQLKNADTDKDVRRITNQVPEGMDQLYKLILDKMSEDSTAELAQAILTWTVCSTRPLAVAELQRALLQDIGKDFLDLKRTIAKHCGDLVDVDTSGKVQLIHATLSEYLLGKRSSKFSISKSAGHSRLSETCFKFLTSKDLQPPIFRNRKSNISKMLNSTDNAASFIHYSCTAFSYHLIESELSAPGTKNLAHMLLKFLKRNVLSWIEFIVHKKDLSPLIHAAKHFKIYAKRHEAKGAEITAHQREAIQSWATDLSHLVTRFGRNMLEDPACIYFLIPPMCPPESQIFRQFADPQLGLRVKGLSTLTWDERLSVINFSGTYVTAAAWSPSRIAVGLEDCQLVLFYTATYQEAIRRRTGETENVPEVKRLIFTKTGNYLASATRKELCLWDSITGVRIHKFPLAMELISLCFYDEDRTIKGVTWRRHCVSCDVKSGEAHPTFTMPSPEPDDQTAFKKPLARATFSPEHKLLAVAYRGDPIWFFDLEQNEWLPRTCRKHAGNVCPINDFLFSPDGYQNLLVVGYSDGDLVLWDFHQPRQIKKTSDVGSQRLAISPDTRTLASGNSSSIQIFDLLTLNRIYVIDQLDYPVEGLYFSPDNDRFIDIRDDQFSVWEPAVLVRSAESSGAEDPLPPPPKIVTADAPQERNNIISMAYHSDGPYVFVGRS